MTTVIAPAHPPTTTSPPHARNRSPLRYSLTRQQQPQPPVRTASNPAMSTTPRIAPDTSAATVNAPAVTAHSSPHSHASVDSTSGRSPPLRGTNPERKSPPSSSRTPLIRVKKEPTSPNMTSSKPRPRRLDLSSGGTTSRGPQTAGVGGAKESAGLAIKDLGVACLSPGFQTQDPTLQERLARSISVKEQQRQLIEARQKGGPSKTPAEGNDASTRAQDESGPPSSRRKGPPPGLSIHAPSAASFAHERVIQSAPLHQSFTGLRQHNVHHPPSNLGQSSHIHHLPAQQTANRLPPISDVFADNRRDGPPTGSFRPSGHAAVHSPSHPPVASPSFPPHHSQFQQPPLSSRSREFRSAEEAVQDMAGGREELLPKLVHYGGAQPPTPPSPPQHPSHQQHPHQQHQAQSHHHLHPQAQHSHQPPVAASAPPHPAHYDPRPDLGRTNSMSGRRRTREEYEHDSPNVHPSEFKRYREREREEQGDWRQTMSSREKKEEFLRLCERAWELFHS